MASAWGLSTYLSYFNTYNLTYGGLAGIVIAQIFLFVVSIAFILGAELNAAYARGYSQPAPEVPVSGEALEQQEN